jgi:hypothetical protein
MVDVIRDIEVLENLLIAFQEGASDEKRMAVNAVERLLKEKQKILNDFEKEFCDDSQQAA